MGKYFTSTQNIFTSQRRVKMWRESKISFPYCKTSVISDFASLKFFQPVTIQFSLIYSLRARYKERTNKHRTIWEIQNARVLRKYSSKNIKAAIKYIYIYIYVYIFLILYLFTYFLLLLKAHFIFLISVPTLIALFLFLEGMIIVCC